MKTFIMPILAKMTIQARGLLLISLIGWVQMATPARAADEMIVVIDPGHGGSKDSGTQAARTHSSSNNAVSPGGLMEKDMTLELCKKIKQQVEALPQSRAGKRIRCVLTRPSDENPDFKQRAEFCVQQQPLPAAIISIHFNASKDHRSLGTLAMIARSATNKNYQVDKAFATRLAQATHDAVEKFVPGSKPLGTITDAHLHDGAGSNFFHQLARYPELNRVPKCFLEVEFMDHPEAERKLLRDRAKSFQEIAKAIVQHLDSELATKPRPENSIPR